MSGHADCDALAGMVANEAQGLGKVGVLDRQNVGGPAGDDMGGLDDDARQGVFAAAHHARECRSFLPQSQSGIEREPNACGMDRHRTPAVPCPPTRPAGIAIVRRMLC